MEDHYERSGDEEDLCKNGTKVAELGMFITDSLLISNRFRIKCFDSSISIPNFDSLFTYDKMLVLVTKNFIKIKSLQKTE